MGYCIPQSPVRVLSAGRSAGHEPAPRKSGPDLGLRRPPRPRSGQPGAADQPRHLHLRDADALGDLRLRQVLDEAQVQDQAVALGQRLERGGDRRGVLDQLEALVLAPSVGEAVAVAVAGRRALRPATPPRRPGRPPSRSSTSSTELVCSATSATEGERPSRPPSSLIARSTCIARSCVAARDVHRPAGVAEVALQLAEDRRHRVGGEGDAAVADRSGRPP